MKKYIKPNLKTHAITIQHIMAESNAGVEQKEPITDGGAAGERIWTNDIWEEEW